LTEEIGQGRRRRSSNTKKNTTGSEINKKIRATMSVERGQEPQKRKRKKEEEA
jgi:hypothetical protein